MNGLRAHTQQKSASSTSPIAQSCLCPMAESVVGVPSHGLTMLLCCRGMQASQGLLAAKVSMALRWVCPSSPPLLAGIFWPLCSPQPFLALSPGRSRSSWLAWPTRSQGMLVLAAPRDE